MFTIFAQSETTLLTIKIRVDGVLVEGAGPKVDELELVGLQVHEQVLVLDVTMQHTLPVARQDGLNNLNAQCVSKNATLLILNISKMVQSN